MWAFGTGLHETQGPRRPFQWLVWRRRDEHDLPGHRAGALRLPVGASASAQRVDRVGLGYDPIFKKTGLAEWTARSGRASSSNHEQRNIPPRLIRKTSQRSRAGTYSIATSCSTFNALLGTRPFLHFLRAKSSQSNAKAHQLGSRRLPVPDRECLPPHPRVTSHSSRVI